MNIIERAIEHPSFRTARAVAHFLNISEAEISRKRRGTSRLTGVQAAKLAEAIGEPWLEHVLPILAELEPNAEDRAYWLGKARTLARAAAVGLVLAAASPSVNALNTLQVPDKQGHSRVMSVIGNRRRKPFRKQPLTRPWHHTARRVRVLRHETAVIRNKG